MIGGVYAIPMNPSVSVEILSLATPHLTIYLFDRVVICVNIFGRVLVPTSMIVIVVIVAAVTIVVVIISSIPVAVIVDLLRHQG